MPDITFPYNDWTKEDVQLRRSGSPLGYASIHASVQPGRVKTVRQGAADKTIGPTLDGVIGMLSGALEWCREYGLTAADVQARVRAHNANNRSSNAQQELLSVQQKNVFEVSDPMNRAHQRDQTKQLGA